MYMLILNCATVCGCVVICGVLLWGAGGHAGAIRTAFLQRKERKIEAKEIALGAH